MDRNSIKAVLYLHAVLPQLKEIVRVDSKAREVLADWHNAISFSVLGGPKLRLEIKAGQIHALCDQHGLSSLALFFFSSNSLVRMFEGSSTWVLPWIGFWRPKLIRGISLLANRLGYYLKTKQDVLKADGKFATAVSIRLMTIGHAIVILANSWEEGQRIMAESMIEGTASIGIVGQKPLQLSKDNGLMRVVTEKPVKANVTVEFSDPDHAHGIMTGTVDIWTAVGTGSVRLRGQISLLEPIFRIMSYVGQFL